MWQRQPWRKRPCLSASVFDQRQIQREAPVTPPANRVQKYSSDMLTLPSQSTAEKQKSVVSQPPEVKASDAGRCITLRGPPRFLTLDRGGLGFQR